MKTMNTRGTRDAAVRGRPPRPGRKWSAAGARRFGWQTAGVLAGALLVLTAAAGCSSGQAVTAGGAGQTPLSQSQGDQDMVSFARCMRSHGVQMADPYHRPGHSGLTLDLPTQDGATRAAYAACTHFIQPIIQAKQAGAAALAAPRMAALTRYAECMRSHDVNMLDPNADGELSLGNVPGMASNDFGRDSPQFRSADAACRHLLPPDVADNGTGP